MPEEKFVEIESADEPTGDPPPRGSKWQRVKIKLTDEQIEELKELGINTEQISIVTYDLDRLSGDSQN